MAKISAFITKFGEKPWDLLVVEDTLETEEIVRRYVIGARWWERRRMEEMLINEY